MRDEIMAVKKQLEEVKEQSLAMELLQDYKKTNKRMFITILVILTMWFATIGAFLYYINTTGYIETEEIAETDDGGNACVGDNCNNGEINYGESSKKN